MATAAVVPVAVVVGAGRSACERRAVPSLVVGLTGGIASGKTSVSDHFRQLGASVIDTDVIARQLVARGQPLLLQLVRRFGDWLLDADGALDRPALRQRVFQHASDRLVLEGIMHPAIRTRSLELLRHAAPPYVILVVPLLLESKTPYPIDRVLVVDLPVETQVARAKQRDGGSEHTIRAIVNTQIDRRKRLERADEVIDNNGAAEALRAKVQVLHQHYLRLAKQGGKH